MIRDVLPKKHSLGGTKIILSQQLGFSFNFGSSELSWAPSPSHDDCWKIHRLNESIRMDPIENGGFSSVMLVNSGGYK